MKIIFKKAFSLVELLVTLVVVAILTAVMSPVVTKKLKSKEITVSSGQGQVEFAQDCSQWEDCALCSSEQCSLCAKDCEIWEYTNTPDCTCQPCTNKSPNCAQCSSKSCSKCDVGYGLAPSNRQCVKCNVGEYSNGEEICKICPENYICSGNDVVPVACATDQWANEGSSECKPCSDILANCVKCKPEECIECQKGYKLKNDVCIIASGSKVFTAAGEHEFEVPEGVEELTVTLVSGGAGGGGGKSESKSKSFSSTTTWTIPEDIKGETVTIDAKGGDGGKGSQTYCSWASIGNPYKGESISKTYTVGASEASTTITIGAKGANSASSYHGFCYIYCGGAGGNTVVFGNTAKGGKGALTTNTVYNDDWSTYTERCSPGGSYTSASTTSSPSAGSAKISWVAKIPGTGGGAGHIVPKRKISVLEGEILTVTVGAGGAGGAIGSNGVGQADSMISKLKNSSGIVVLSSAPSISTMGATGGNYDGTTVGVAGWINIGTTAEKTTMDGFSNTDGNVSSGKTGGNGGTTTIEGLATLCSAGVGGSGVDVAGSNATGFGGCGGGGGGAGAKGGNGAPGYVKISWGDE